MRRASRPISSGITWSVRVLATASSRPFNVASPSPCTPSSVSIFNVTKFRPGEQTITFAATIFMLGTLGGFPNPPAKGSVEQSSTSPARSLVHPAREVAAVDDEDVAVDERRRVRRQEDRRARHLLD